jgi:hypothetical protein
MRHTKYPAIIVATIPKTHSYKTLLFYAASSKTFPPQWPHLPVAITSLDIPNTGFLHSGQRSPNRVINLDVLIHRNEKAATMIAKAPTFKAGQMFISESLRFFCSQAIRKTVPQNKNTKITTTTATALR